MSSSQDTMDDLRNKIARASDLEAQLQNLSKKKSSEERSSRIRMQLCEILSDIMLVDPHFAMRKDCAGRLWRNCFYGRIGELRSLIAREKRKKGPSVKKLEQNLKTFLDEAITLYRWIVNKYESKLLPQLTPSQQSQDSSASQDTSANSTAGVIPGLHRLLIHLGDLNRYAESYKDAEKCYSEASKLAPGKGNPYNQLAVVAQLKADGGKPQSCVGLYWYARSLLATKDPFATSKANLARMFESNRDWLKLHGQEEPVVPPAPAGVWNKKALLDQARAQKSAATQRFLARFVDVHYDFFLAADNNSIEETALVQKLEDLMDTFSSLVDATAFGDSLLIKIVTINSFSIHTAKLGTTGRELATALFLRVGASLAQRVESTLQKLVAAAQQHNTNMPSVRLVVPLVLICDYLSTLRDENLLLENVQGTEASEFCRQAVCAFWRNIATVANLLNPLREGLHPDSLQYMRLKEYDNLVGFLPFQSFVAKAGAVSDVEDAYVSADAAVKLLDLLASSTQESVASISSGNEEENRLKLLRFLQAVDRFVRRWEKGDWRKGLLMRDDSGLYKFTGDVEEDDIVSDEENGPAMDFACDSPEVTTTTVVEKQAPPKVPLVEGNQQESGRADVLMYKQPEGGSGPALLVPGALLTNQTEESHPETSITKAPAAVGTPEVAVPLRLNDVLREVTSGNHHSDPPSSFLTGISPQPERHLGEATPSLQRQSITDAMDVVVEEKATKPLAKEAPPPGFGPPPGFAGATAESIGAFSSEARAPAVAPLPPPGFSFPTDSAQQGATVPSFGASGLSELRTSNPFAAEYSQPSIGNLANSSSQGLGLFGSTYSQQPSHFLDTNLDSSSGGGASLLESSFLTNLWMEESHQNDKPPLSKNPFLT